MMAYSNENYHNDLEKLKQEHKQYEVLTRSEIEASWQDKKQGDERMEEIKQESTNWLEQEEKSIKTPMGDFEKLPAINTLFAENKIVKFYVNATAPFRKWDDEKNDKIKAIIPVLTKETNERMVFFLNISNPLYKDIVHVCREATDKSKVYFAVIQTGTKQTTQYKIVKE